MLPAACDQVTVCFSELECIVNSLSSNLGVESTVVLYVVVPLSPNEYFRLNSHQNLIMRQIIKFSFWSVLCGAVV